MQMSSPPHHRSVTNPVSALLEAGYASLEAADEARAEALFRRAVQLDPLSEAAWRGLADTQFGARRGICLRWAEYARTQRKQAAPVVHRRTPPRPSRRLRRAVGAAVGLAVLLVVGTDVAYRERYLPGVQVGSTELAHLQVPAGHQALRARQRALEQRIVTIKAEELQTRIPLTKLLQQHLSPAHAAFAYGHERSFVRRAVTRFSTFAGRKHIIDDTEPNQAAVREIVARFAAQARREQRDAQLLHTAAGWQIVPEQAGRALDEQQLVRELERLVDAADVQAATRAIVVAPMQIPPTRRAADLEPARRFLNDLAAMPLTVQVGDERWLLDRSLLLDLDAMTSTGVVKPHLPLIGQQIEQIAQAVAVAPQPSHLVREGDRVRALVPGQVGHELDRDDAARQIRLALTTNAETVQLALRELPPPPGEIEQLGLLEELGRGESQFSTYSSPERDANVHTGGIEIDGVLIGPGKLFSFTQTIADITWEEGYRWGEMIEAGAVVPSLGGGICQVSTTMFRAALWSGLDIVERHPHSWRLPWYEVDAPPGMDSTIALGGPDLKVRNNTQHHMLIKVETDLEHKRQTVIIYGTRDGRQIAMEPIAGSNIGVRRRVIQGDQAVADEIYMSYYSQ